MNESASAEPATSYRDVVVVGASAGGLEALKELLAALPPEFPASILVVQHLAASEPSVLASILTRAGSLDVRTPTDGEAIERGQVFVAPPDHHMLLDDGHVRLTRGPRENGNRPAIDSLFRSAARAHGERVVAVLLSGLLDDGTAGMRVVKRSGGIAVVQDPADASFPSMPQNAIDGAEPEHVVSVRELAPLLCELVETPVAPPSPPAAVPDEQDRPPAKPDGEFSGLICPECGGPLWELEDGPLVHFKCKTGHSYSPATLEERQGEALEGALWTALRTLSDRAALLRRLGRRGPSTIRARRESRAESVDAHAAVVREALAQIGRTGEEREGEPAEVH